MQGRRISREDIAETFRRGRRIESSHFVLRMLKSPVPRGGLTVVVSKEVAKSAVVRNRLKRRSRALLKAATEQHPHYFFVLHYKKGASLLSFQALQEEIRAALARAVQ